MTAPLTVPQARRWLKAVRELSASYKTKSNHDEGHLIFCPFCKVAINCSKCLWEILAKTDCTDHCHKHFNAHPSDLRHARDPRWVKLSLARLKRWEKRLIKIVGDK